jgi:UDP-N-acetylglucosamine 2-epimerase (non-hydrolysing)
MARDISEAMANKILVVLGTRPEAIKLAPVVLGLGAFRGEMKTIVCSTAQHKTMLSQVLATFRIEPDIDLDIMTKNQSLPGLTATMLTKLSEVLGRVKPDLVVVQGDTTTAMVAGLASYYARCPVAHVEAGLRTHDKLSPFPEEINRRLLDCLSDLYFAPTAEARANLIGEGFADNRIFVTGNTIVDSLMMILKRVQNPREDTAIRRYFQAEHHINVSARKMILVTAHRRESFGHDLQQMCLAMRDLATGRPDLQIVYPVHLNPNVQAAVRKDLSGLVNVHLIRPLGYDRFIWLMSQARVILTDSGGVQEEAPTLRVPVLVMRKKTERPEGIAGGAAKLVGVSRREIVDGVIGLLDGKRWAQKTAFGKNPYGDGRASSRIVRIIKKELGGR